MTQRNEHSLAEAVLSRIEKESIAPTPRWHFLLREGVVCTVGLVSIGVGVLAVVAIIFEMSNAWWERYEATHDSVLTFAVDALPLIWILTLLIFSLLLYESVRFTKRGYRYALHTLVFATIGISSVGGGIVYVLGGGPFADEWVGGFIPFHRPLIDREQARWMDPDDGRLAGIVREVPFADSVLWLEGADGQIYHVDTSDFVQNDRQVVRVGDHVRVVGIATSTPFALHGCILFIHNNDILERKHSHMVLGKEVDAASTRERNPLFARSKKCEGVPPYARLLPKE